MAEDIKVDLNQITRREFRKFLADLDSAKDGFERDDLTGALIEKVVVSWPFDEEITKDGYLSLGLADSNRVDALLTDALNGVGKKK
jgi:hypothetical protein